MHVIVKMKVYRVEILHRGNYGTTIADNTLVEFEDSIFSMSLLL